MMQNGTGDGAFDVPDQTSKPTLDRQAAPDLVQYLFGLRVTSVKQLNGYDDINFHVRVKSVHDSPYVKSVCPDGYTLKVMNAVESKRPGIVESQHQLMWMLKSNGFGVPCPVPTLDGVEWALVRLRNTPGPAWRPTDADDPSSEHIVRLLEFVPGDLLHSVPYTPPLMFQIGETAARISNCIQGFWHPIYAVNDSNWYLRNVGRAADFTWAVQDPDRRTMAEAVIQGFREQVLPKFSQLPQGCLHGDLNEQNILVRSDGADGHRVCGVLDFGDSHHSALVFELVLVIMYLMIECTQVPRLDVGGHVLAGYSRHRRLNELELSVLKMCVCGRFAQSLVLGAHAYAQNPANSYVLVTATNGWAALKLIWDAPQEELLQRWSAIAEQYSKP